MNLFKITTAVFAATLLTSCSSNNDKKGEESNELTTLCDCVKLSGTIIEEIETTDPSEKSQEEIEASYTYELEICDSISKEYQKGFDQLSQEELKSKQDEFFRDCPEADELNKKMEAKMQQEMQMQQGSDEEMQQQQPATSEGMEVK